MKKSARKVSPLGKYMVAYPISNSEARELCSEIKRYLSRYVSGLSLSFPHESHVTLIPPFRTDYENAAGINLTFALHDLGHNATTFCFGGLAFFRNEQGEDTLYLEVIADEHTKEKIHRLRKNFEKDFHVEFLGERFSETIPHVTICKGVGISKNTTLQKMVETYNRKHAHYVNAMGHQKIGNLMFCLYGKYKTGWELLSHDPGQE